MVWMQSQKNRTSRLIFQRKNVEIKLFSANSTIFVNSNAMFQTFGLKMAHNFYWHILENPVFVFHLVVDVRMFFCFVFGRQVFENRATLDSLNLLSSFFIMASYI